LEDNTTAFLVRSTATGWKKGSVLAVDAGVHLASIVRILENHPSDSSPDHADKPVTLINGPFEGLEIPHSLAKSNAAYITRTLVGTYLITHPHLDHISGFVVNTAALQGSRPKVLAGLPSTIEAFKDHIFNNVIWPNLSDENNGAGLVTYRRLVEGGSPALGQGDDKGYIEICEGLGVKTLSVSHGHCIERHSHRGSNVGLASSPPPYGSPPQTRQRTGSQVLNPPLFGRSPSVTNIPSLDMRMADVQERICVYDSSAYFIRDIATGKEVLIFGDVEPDAISLWPRNKQVWIEAAPKIASGRLGGILIECSFDDSQTDDRLYGHLAPRYLIEELKALADEVELYKKGKEQATSKERPTSKKRKRLSATLEEGARQHLPRTRSGRTSSPSPRSRTRSQQTETAVTEAGGSEAHTAEAKSVTAGADSRFSLRGKNKFPLKGVKIVIIHVKDTLDDGPGMGTKILEELTRYEEEEQIGCEFVISKMGQAVYL
jgi:cAMP phosphodiesterase